MWVRPNFSSDISKEKNLTFKTGDSNIVLQNKDRCYQMKILAFECWT